MAPWIHFPLYFLSIVIIFCHVVELPVTALTIKLIHRYAPESPFYNANLTNQEIVERLNFQTRTRKQSMSLISSTSEENGTLLNLQHIRPSLDFQNNPPLSAFLVKVNIGTFSGRGASHKSYYLDLVTTSTISWLQCEDCKRSPHRCYRQIEPPFPNSKSSSYTPLPCGKNPFCFQNECIRDSCSYNLGYFDDSHSIGILALENFAFSSSTGHEEIVRLVFGCGIDNKYPIAQERDIKTAGVFGLGWGPHSFVTQINSINEIRFAYCLPSTSQAAQGVPIFLRFGSDIPSYSTLLGTELIKYQDDEKYHVKLLDISVNGARLNIPSRFFLNRGPYEGGRCIFSTGSTATRVSPSTYRMVKRAVETHIERSVTSLEMVTGMFGNDLCYRASKPFRGHRNLPSITFHFNGSNADLVVKPESAFYHNSHNSRYDYICLDMVSDEWMTVIGSNSQANHFIVYDLSSRKLYFGPRDCSRNL